MIDVVTRGTHDKIVDLAKSVAPVFSRLKQLAEEREAVSETAFQDWLMQRIDGVASDAWLDCLSIPAAIGFCEALGITTIHGAGVKVSTLSTADLARAAEEGFRVADGGEEHIKAHLEMFVARQRKPGMWGMAETFGHFYRALWIKRNDPDWQVPRDLLRDFAMDQIPFATGTDILGTVVTERRVHSIYTAMTDAGRRGDFVRRMLEREGHAVPSDIEPLSDHKVVVDAAVLADTIEEMKTAMPTVKAATVLGMDRHHLSRAIKLNMIATVGGTNQIEHTVHWLSQDAVEAFKERVFAGAVEIESAGQAHVTIGEAKRRAKCSVSALLKLIVWDGLTWKGFIRGNRRVDSLLVDVDEILRATERKVKHETLTQRAACEALGISTMTIGPLIEAGFLATVMAYNTSARRHEAMFTPESLAVFSQTYMPLGKVSDMWKVHPQTARVALKRAAIYEILRVVGRHTMIFRRDEVPEKMP